jgi:hypothetical protein
VQPRQEAPPEPVFLCKERLALAVATLSRRGEDQNGKERVLMQRPIAAFLLVATRWLGAAEATGAPPSSVPRDARDPVRVKVEGALLSYLPLPLPAEKRTPEGEIEVLRLAVGTLHVDRPVAFRRVQLPAGEYELRVESEGRGHRLVIAAAPATGGADGAEREEGKRRARRRGSSTAPAGEAAPALEKKTEREPRASRGENGGGNGVDRDGEAAPGAAGGGRRAPSADGTTETREKDPSLSGNGEPQAPSVLRVPLTLASCEAAADKLGFDLKISNRGTKLKVLIRAGSTEARASLRFADAAR